MSPHHGLTTPAPPGHVGHQACDVEAPLSLKRKHLLLLMRVFVYLDIEVIITKDLHTKLQDFQADRITQDGDAA